ncbi:alpha/beta fold hydrolase [Ohtaekwangia kribbensis]|jgi:sigma-B regulation protein RsbQ|uniref:Alpha/beta fold hydrolase n=1 Tax=Ohtaekwangia kribbensis TaxID=688913 RepID=A0ABW3K2B0_9BACT
MTILANETVIDYVQAGDGEITLLFVHGAFINKEYWREQIEYFKTNYSVVAVDLPGHGQSGRDRVNWTIHEFGKDIVSIIDSLKLSNVVLIGHSMGADIILEAASMRKDSIIGVVVIDALKNAGEELNEEVQQQVDSILEQLNTNFADTVETYAQQGLLSPDTDPKITHTIINDYRNAYQPMGIRSVQDVFSFPTRERELLQSLPFKIYLINVDYIPTNEELLRKYASAGYELHIIHGTSHFPMLEEPQVLNEALEKVIDKINEELILVR